MEVIALLALTARTELFPTLAATGLSPSQIVLLVVILGLSAAMILSARRRRSRDGHSPRAYAREQVARLREEAEVKEDLEAVLGQVQDIARQMNAQLETKFYKLEKVIRDADARIADLDRLVRQADGRPVCDVTVGDAVNESSGETPPYPVPGGDRRYAQVYEFADAGLSPGEIAEQTGHTAGEVELILALRRHAAPSAGG